MIIYPGLSISKNGVIPAQAGIQMIGKIPTSVGQHHGFVRFAACFL